LGVGQGADSLRNLKSYITKHFAKPRPMFLVRHNKWLAVVNVLTNLRVSYNSGDFLTCWRTVSFSRRTVLHGVS